MLQPPADPTHVEHMNLLLHKPMRRQNLALMRTPTPNLGVGDMGGAAVASGKRRYAGCPLGEAKLNKI